MDTHPSDVPRSAAATFGTVRSGSILAGSAATRISRTSDGILSSVALATGGNSTLAYRATAGGETLCDICPACLGRGWVHFPSARCSWCAGTGRIKRPDLPTPEEQIDYTEMLEREDDIADDLARADEAAWREENSDG